MQSGEAHRDADERQQERQAGGDEHSERDEQQDQARQAAQQLGLVQRLFVDRVEVTPHGPLTGHLGLCTRRKAQRRDVLPELTGGFGPLRVGGDSLRHRHDRRAAVGRDQAR